MPSRQGKSVDPERALSQRINVIGLTHRREAKSLVKPCSEAVAPASGLVTR